MDTTHTTQEEEITNIERLRLMELMAVVDLKMSGEQMDVPVQQTVKYFIINKTILLTTRHSSI